MQIDKIFELTEQRYNQFVNRGDDWPSFPPQMHWDKYVRKYILNKGSADFGKDFIKPGYKYIRPSDKVTLYCSRLGYFAAHYYSSFAAFQKLKDFADLTDKSILFVDFGCGPATSGLSFVDSFNSKDIEYIGIDSAAAMRERAKEFLAIYQIKKYEFHQNFTELNGKLSQKENEVILLNFSFLLASKTFTGDLKSLLNIIQKEIKNITKTRIIFVYQNPLKTNHSNWQILKEEMREYGFKSIIASEGNQLGYYNEQQKRQSNTYFDILTN